MTQETGSRHYQWDAADQLRQFATWTGAGTAPTLLAYYVYAGGQRVKKLTQTSVDTWQVTVYAEGGFEHHYEVSQGARSGEQTQVAVLDGQHRLYQRRSGDALGDQRPDKLYALDDHLGSAAAQTDAGGQLVSREEYYPFGETSFGSTQKQRYRFCGKELDEESGLYYYGARYYAPWLCRFISTDPKGSKYVYQSSYTYASNNPLNLQDFNGEGPAEGADGSGQSAAPTHTIAKGETFWNLEKQLHLAHGVLAKANPGVEPTNLQIGQTINLGPPPAKPDMLPTYARAIEQTKAYTGDEGIGKSFDHTLHVRASNVTTWNVTEFEQTRNLWDEFQIGYGPQNSLFLPNHPVTKDLKGYMQSETDRIQFLM